MAVVRRLLFLEIQFLTDHAGQKASVTVLNFMQIVEAVAEIWPLWGFFKMAGVRHLGYRNIQNFNGLSGQLTKFRDDMSNRC